MRIVALVVWCATTCFGIYLLTAWVSDSGLRRQATRITMFPAAFIFAHPLVAALGLALWVAFVETGRRGFAWAGFGVLSVSAMLGFAMLTRWLVGGGGRHARGVEQHFPGRVVALHGTVGLGTYVLVLITAIRG